MPKFVLFGKPEGEEPTTNVHFNNFILPITNKKNPVVQFEEATPVVSNYITVF